MGRGQHGATWGELLAARAASDEAALVVRDRVVTYAELTALAGGVADWLDGVAAPPRRPIAALVSTAVDAAALVLAASATHRPVAPLNVRTTVTELLIVLERLQPSMVVAEPGALAVGREAGGRLGLPVLDLPVSTGSARRLDFAAVDPGEPVAVLHTSGTSGVPKAVPYLQGPLAERVRLNSRLLGLGPGSRYATASPFHHAAGIGNLSVALGCGAAMCPLAGFSAGTWQELLDVGATHATLVPTMIDRLLDQGPLSPGELRCLQYGGSAIHPDTLRRLLEALPGVELVQFYGQTEGTPLTMLTTADHRRAMDEGALHLLRSAGRAIDGVELVVQDPDAEGIGEVLARAAHLMLPGPDGWLHTGDLATIDGDGYVSLIGRKGDMIIRGGENVYPDEIEAVLARHPALAEVAVAGRPDRRLGHVVTAHMVLAPGATRPADAALRAFARADLAGFKVPEQWYWVDELPRTASGKVLRRLL